MLGIRRTHDEAHLPAKEAQASPSAWVPQPHALPRGQADTQASPREGAQATVYLNVRIGR